MTTIAGQYYFNECDLVDYHRPATTKDDWGGWNGPFLVGRNDPDRGQVELSCELGIAMYESSLVVQEIRRIEKS
eukprot:9040349-Pyramimonas_sp.AAC.1